MADGQWGTIAFALPDVLQDVRDQINDLADFLLQVLGIVVQALELLKTVLVNFLDPMAAIIQAIVNELEALLQDLRQMGVYLTGDWRLMSYPYEELKGGFAEYERRMIARLTDRTDPTRPDISVNTEVLALFFYLSVDVSQVERLKAFIDALLKFFQQSYQAPTGLPTPVISNVLYAPSLSEANFPRTLTEYFGIDPSPPTAAVIKWVLPDPAAQPFNPVPPIPPGGFMITLSTIKDGIRVVYDRPQAGDTTKPGVTDTTKQVQPREYGPVLVGPSGDPLILFGGSDMLNLPEGLQYISQTNSDGTPQDGVTRVYGMLPDSSIFPLEDLYQGSYLMQRVFYLDQSETFANFQAWVTSEFTSSLDTSMLPRTARVEMQGGIPRLVDDGPATTVYVRVAVCNQELTAKASFDSTKGLVYDFEPLVARKQATGDPRMIVEPRQPYPDSFKGPFSAPAQVTIPNAQSQAYLESLKAGLAVLVFSRPDLVPLDTLQNTLSPQDYQDAQADKLLIPNVALARCSLEGQKHLAGLVYEDYPADVTKRDSNPRVDRGDLLQRIEKVAQDIYNITGPNPDLEAFVAGQTVELRTVTWKTILKSVHPQATPTDQDLEGLDKTILSSLNPVWSILEAGVALNPYSMDLPEVRVQNLLTTRAVQDRKPQMMEVYVGGDGVTTTPYTIPKAEIPAVLAAMPPSLLEIYERCPLDDDGNMLVPENLRPVLAVASDKGTKRGSADESPVLYYGQDRLKVSIDNGGIFYIRGLLAQYQDGQILQQANLALGIAAAAIRKSLAGGEWLSIRFLDSFTGIDDVLRTIIDWVKALQGSTQGIVDAILRYINAVEARIIDLQQLIRRINALLQSILGYSFNIPACSALAVVGQGTTGVLSSLVTAENKPYDSPLSYGGGVAMLVPLGAAWITDLLREIFKTEEGSPTAGAYLSTDTPVTGITGVPSTPVTDPEPDVL